uniref:Uncharacterized protein LOC104242892 n=1 Tax=Nicotiana sylvestris TaxID=4096 RepID=A0A1U7XWB6_NICSY|nr:PREDICTED: uncharacterized protein LOC104242892 [Nicotiana sylvestris]
MLLPSIPNEWEAEAFTKRLNPRSSVASRKLKKSFLEFQETTWADLYNRYESKIRIEDEQLDFPTSVVTLLKNGHLREFLSDHAKDNYCRNRDNTKSSKAGEVPPRLTTNMIFWGNEINRVTFSIEKKMKVSITYRKRLREVAEDDITLTEEDVDRLLLPYNDALVISLNVLDFKIKCVLVDLGSSANIIQWTVMEQAKLTRSIILATKLLIEFNLASVTIGGEILQPTNAEGVMRTTLFEVLDGDMGYNIILGRPWLHVMKAVPSTYHQLLKFPTPE